MLYGLLYLYYLNILYITSYSRYKDNIGLLVEPILSILFSLTLNHYICVGRDKSLDYSINLTYKK